MDPSLSNYETSTTKISNIGGIIGSYLADILIRFLGLSAYWLPLFLLITSVKLFLDAEFLFRPGWIGGFIGLIVTTSGLFAQAYKLIPLVETPFAAGGFAGTLLSEYLTTLFNPGGTFIFLLVGLIVSLIVTVELSVVTALRKVGRCRPQHRQRDPVLRKNGTGEGDGLPAGRARGGNRRARSTAKRRETASTRDPRGENAGTGEVKKEEDRADALRVRRAQGRLHAPAPDAARRRAPPGHEAAAREPDRQCAAPGKEACRFRRRGKGHGGQAGARHHHVRARTRAGREDQQDRQPLRRPGPRPQGAERAHRRAHPRQGRHRHRDPQPRARRRRPPGRHRQRGLRPGQAPAAHRAGRGHHGDARDRRSHPDAPPAHRGDDGLGEKRLPQRAHLQPALQGVPRRGEVSA